MSNSLSVDLKKLEELAAFESIGLGLSLAKFAEINFDAFKRLSKAGVPLKVQAEYTKNVLKKPVTASTLKVAISRLNKAAGLSGKEKENVYIVKKDEKARFMPLDAKLRLEGFKLTKKGKKTEGDIEYPIAWRSKKDDESLSSWIADYKDEFHAINAKGWRWAQIAEAITEYLELTTPLKENTLTSIVSLLNKAKKGLPPTSAKKKRNN